MRYANVVAVLALAFGTLHAQQSSVAASKTLPQVVGGKTERSTHTVPFLESLQAELGGGRFRMGSVGGKPYNTTPAILAWLVSPPSA